MKVISGLEKPNGLFTSQFDQIAQVEDPSERTFYYAMFGYDLIMDTCRPFEADSSKVVTAFTPDVPYERYILPGVGGNGSFEDVFRYYQPSGTVITHEVAKVGAYSIAYVPQGDMYGFPIDTNPLLYLSMTECSALVARNQTHLYVAHIGLSETGEVIGALKFFNQHGISSDRVKVHASLGDTNYDSNVVTPHFDYRHAKADTYRRLGILEENIYPFEYRFKVTPETKTHQNSRGVFVGANFHVAFSFDFNSGRSQESGNAELKDIVAVEGV